MFLKFNVFLLNNYAFRINRAKIDVYINNYIKY